MQENWETITLLGMLKQMVRVKSDSHNSSDGMTGANLNVNIIWEW